MYKLFVDLDGVLADFERGVKKFTGKYPREFESLGKMWKAVSAIDDFYNRLDWMPDGKFLWESVEPFHPTILTGIPYGNIPWAEQKRKWVDRHLGKHVKMTIKYPRETKLDSSIKAHSTEYSHEGKESVWILIDDDTKHKQPWIDGVGIFIHHVEAVDTIAELINILEQDKD